MKLTTITTSTLAVVTAINALSWVFPLTKTEDIKPDPAHPDQILQLPTISDQAIWPKGIPRKLGYPLAEAP